MPRIPFFRLGPAAEDAAPPILATYFPAISLQGLQLGVDNLRHDVSLSPKFVEHMRLHVARLIARHGNVESLLAAEPPKSVPRPRFIGGPEPRPKVAPKPEPSELKPLLLELHMSALKRAKTEGNLALDILARLAILKFLRTELYVQFSQILERCRMMLKHYELTRPHMALDCREQVANFQVTKKIILRKAGQDLFRTLREIEKQTLAPTRRSLFGKDAGGEYNLFLNTLIFTEDGRDTYLNAEHYVMLGNFERDPDRFSNVRRVACDFLRCLDLAPEADRERTFDGWLSVPDNALSLMGAGSPNDSSAEGRAQANRLAAWTKRLDEEKLLEYVVASYEVAPLLAEYSPRINPQQLKNALISQEEHDRVEKLIEEHSSFSVYSFHAAVERVVNCRRSDRAKMAGRFFHDFLRYHRDFRRLEALNGALDSVNLTVSEKIRELSAVNGTLYEFLLPEEQKPSEDRVVRHVILKADVRDSSRLTRSLLEQGLNPASYFSLNFYDPVNKLLAKYGATKVFLEGDAIILAILEREGEPGLAVGRACVLAREIIEIVRGYNQLLDRAGLPTIELGIGISYQDSAPMYLMDGDERIMISDALNESDRLSSCSKRVRKSMQTHATPFNVYAFQTVNDAEAGESPDDFLLKYNLNGIRMSEAAFCRLQQEISLAPCPLDLPALWEGEQFQLHSGLVPVGEGIFRKIIIRGSRMPQIDLASFALRRWTDRTYYEVCSNFTIYDQLEMHAAAAQ